MAHNLPLQLTKFIGREREIVDLTLRLSNTRLLTLTGTGGVGKTRLAIEVARKAVSPHTYLVEFAPILDQALVLRAIASVMGIAEVPGEALFDTLSAALQSGRTLVLLDNCEHLVVACAEAAERLLRACPLLTILATSREPLNVPGEVVWRAAPLQSGDGAALFVDRASSAEPTFRQTPQSTADIERLCEQLDGLPLAIELAAASVRILSVPEITARLGLRFDLLASRGLTAPMRHQTLRALVDWSYELLSADESRLFRRLSVFAGGCSFEAIESICGEGAIHDSTILSALQGLVEKSLVFTEEHDGGTRYRMLETLRQYAREKLRDSREERSLRRRHLLWFRDLAARGEVGLAGPESPGWRRILEVEIDNIRVGLTWARIEPSEREAGLELAVVLGGFWWSSGRLAEGREWVQTLLAGVAAGASRVRALAAFAALCIRMGEPGHGESAIEEALPLARRLGDPSLIANVLTNLCQVRLYLGDLEAAEAASDEALALFRGLGGGLGLYYQLVRHCRIMEGQGKPERALACCEEALALARAAENRAYVCIVLCRLGNLLLEAGQLAAARERLEEGVRLMQEMTLAPSSTPVLHYLAGLTATEGDMAGALKLAGAAVGHRKVLGGRLLPPELALLERRLLPAYQALGPVAAEAAWNEGAAMSLDEALHIALRDGVSGGDVQGSRPTAATGEPAPGLTHREREVVQLIAQGFSNPQIATTLVISRRTVERHVENMLRKLQLTGRSQLAVWAFEHNMVHRSENPMQSL
jgi:predicted ATPase/DNA-binding CsgD family transcriptional regulator